MYRMLGSKATFTGADVAYVWRHIGDFVEPEEADQAVQLAAAETRSVLEGQCGDAVYGWSGGKDSVALQVVMEHAGVRAAVMGSVPALEFAGFNGWWPEHAPGGLVHIPNHDVDLGWLAERGNGRFLFPASASDGYRWTMLGTRRAQLVYQERYKPVVQIYGRRRQDGNVVPAEPVYRTKSGMAVYNPIRDWCHELVLGVIWYFGRGLPPVYGFDSGWRSGTGPWPGRRVARDRAGAWADVWAIEPDRVREAAEVLPEAARWLAVNGLT